MKIFIDDQVFFKFWFCHQYEYDEFEGVCTRDQVDEHKIFKKISTARFDQTLQHVFFSETGSVNDNFGYGLSKNSILNAP